MISVERLAHLVLSVRDVRASKAFYTKVLGLKVANENIARGMVFLSNGSDHHQLALFQRATGPTPDETQPGLIHMAWRLADLDALRAAYRELKADGIEIESTIRHAMTHSLYVRDPDGHLVELYCDRWDNGFEIFSKMPNQNDPIDLENDNLESDELVS
jgi:catechol-2,3-dioxygenase